MRTGCTLPVSLLCACVLAGGCADPIAHRTADFAAVAAPALTDVQGGYTLAESAHTAAVIAKDVSVFDTTSIEAVREPLAFGTAQDLQVRAQILALLTGYLAQLAALSGPRKVGAVAAKAAGTAAGAAAADALKTPEDLKVPTLSNAPLVQAASAIETLEGLLVKRARRRALPHILAQADGPVGQICTTLRRDFGEPGTPGLRSQVRADYELRITLADAALRHPRGSYSYPERQRAIEAELALVYEEQQADAALAAIEDVLAQVAAAHHALLTSGGHARNADFQKALGRLALQASDLGVAEHQLVLARPDAAGRDMP